MRGGWHLLGVTVVLAFVAACASSPDVIPEPLKSQVDESVTFPQLAQAPESYTGKTVVLGGEVRRARRTREGTELEVLELPLDKSHRPAADRMASRGRFVALDRAGHDPAAFPPGAPVTVVGEVTGAITQRVDEVEDRFPKLDVKHVHLWTDDPYVRRAASGPAVGIGIGIGGGAGGTFGGISIGTGF